MHCNINEDGEAVSQPLDSLDSVLNWRPGKLNVCCPELEEDVSFKDHFKFQHTCHEADRPKVLVCHDMAGGYLQDRFVQYCPREASAYGFYHWQLIDVFVYFSHHFITIPPPGWIRSAHKHSVQILGTIITEWDDGAKLCKEMLASDIKVEEVTTQLANIAAFYDFDGWLINIENKIEVHQLPLLQKFVSQLRTKCHLRLRHGCVLWYDSVTNEGDLQWQDELNCSNEMFFDVCDGIFLNYCINQDKLRRSREKASERSRQRDVYVGIDVFGRSTPGGGGFNCRKVLEMILKEHLSCAIFAPGWVMEQLGSEHFQDNNIK